MRPGAEYAMVHGPAVAASGAVVVAPPRSPWQSPVPYLFAGFAVMLGLIAMSLLALSCSYYWNDLSAGPDDEEEPGGGAGRRADGEKLGSAAAGLAGEWRRVHVVVIMAGDERPTFLATPACGHAAVDGAGPPASVTASSTRSTEEASAAACEAATTQPAGSVDDDARTRISDEQSNSSIISTSIIS